MAENKTGAAAAAGVKEAFDEIKRGTTGGADKSMRKLYDSLQFPLKNAQ